MYLALQHTAYCCYIPVHCSGIVSLQVPPMPPAQTKEVIESELNAKLEQVFEWIDLDKPLGSASISQVPPSVMSPHGSLLCTMEEDDSVQQICRTRDNFRHEHPVSN